MILQVNAFEIQIAGVEREGQHMIMEWNLSKNFFINKKIFLSLNVVQF